MGTITFEISPAQPNESREKRHGILQPFETVIQLSNPKLIICSVVLCAYFSYYMHFAAKKTISITSHSPKAYVRFPDNYWGLRVGS